jgi:hypothetical protein
MEKVRKNARGAAVMRGRWLLGAYQLKRAYQVDLVRNDLPPGALETTGYARR